MASGKIVVTNGTKEQVNFSVSQNGQAFPAIVSGMLEPSGSSGFDVSGYDLYQVNFFAVSGTVINEPDVNAGAQVEFSISSIPHSGS